MVSNIRKRLRRRAAPTSMRGPATTGLRLRARKRVRLRLATAQGSPVGPSAVSRKFGGRMRSATAFAPARLLRATRACCNWSGVGGRFIPPLPACGEAAQG
jgi:hypothetical protein